MIVLLGLTGGVGLAEQPQGPWLGLELALTPGETDAGAKVLGELIVRNLGAEEETFDAIGARLPEGVYYVGQAVGSTVGGAALQDGELRWPGPFALEPGAELEIRFWLVTGGEESVEGFAVETAVYGEGQVLTSADFSLALGDAPAPAATALIAETEASSPARPEALQVTKTAEPTSVEPGQGVAYEVVFRNTGGSAVTLDRITDKLPSPFQYVGLAVGSEVTQEPSDGKAPQIVWTGAFKVSAGESLTLRYWAWVPPDTPSRATPYTNLVTANYGGQTSVDSADVTVGTEDTTMYSVYMPLALKNHRVAEPKIYFQDDFEQGDGNWTVYTNLSRLEPEQWYWEPNGGYLGTHGYTHVWNLGRPPGKEGAEDAISMYLGEGSEEWSNYRATVMFNVHGGKKAGLWFLGTFDDNGTRGQWFEGYYCMVAVRGDEPDDNVQLKQMRTYDDYGEYPPADERNYYHFTNPFDLTTRSPLVQDLNDNQWYELKVEVKKVGENAVNIKCYVDDELAIDHTDNEGAVYTSGTIGLKTYGSQGDFAVMSFDDVLVEPLD
jgi:uncharacterized repeat protein (TIGR01451 family)